MAYNEDDWLNFNLNELTKTESPPPSGYFDNIENLQLDDNAASPMRDLDVGYTTDLAVPLGDFQYSDPQNGGQSQIYQSMHTMQNANSYDMQASTSGNVEYNAFELPQVVPINGTSMDVVDTYTDLSNLDQNNSFYSNQQPSTSDQHQMQMIGTRGMDNGYGPPQQQQHLMQMQPSTSYMQPVDGSMQGGMSTDQQMMMQLQQPNNQQQQQPPPQPPPSKPTPKKKAPNRKKQPAANNSVGAVLTKVNKMSQQMSGGGDRLETRMTAEESVRIAQLMSSLQQYQMETGVDNTARINDIQAELAAIFANNLSSAGASTAIVSQIQSLTTAPAQQQQQQQQQQQPQQLHHMQQQQAPAPIKKAAPKRIRNNTPKMAPSKLMEAPPQATIIPANRYAPPDSPTYQPQMMYQQQQQSNSQQQQEILQSMPSTSSQYMDYTQSNQPIQMMQQQGPSPQNKVPSMNSRQHVYRQQVTYQHSGPATPQQQHQQQNQPPQQQQQQQQPFQGQQVYVQQQGQPILIQQQQQSEPTLGDVVKQQQQQLRFQSQQDSALRQQLLNSNNSSQQTAKQMLSRGGNNRRVSLNSPQPLPQQQQQQQQQQQMQQPSPLAPNHHHHQQQPPPQPMQTIKVTLENSNMFPNVAIGSVLQLMPSNQQPPPLPPPQHQQHQQLHNAQAQHQHQQQHQRIQQQQQQYDSMPIRQKFEELPPKEPEFVVPEATPEELAEMAEQARMEREAKLRQLLDQQFESMQNPRFTPFEDMRDVVRRLLPFHLHYEPDVSQKAFDDFDENWFRHTANVEKQKKILENRVREVCLRSTFIHSDRAENNMMIYLDTERERRKLEQDKEAAAQNLDEFVSQSEIVCKFRNGILEQPKPLDFEKPEEIEGQNNYLDYEYNDFDENYIRIPSPYVSPILSPKFSPKKRSNSRKDSASSSFSLQSPPPPMFASPISFASSSNSTAEPMAPKTLINDDDDDDIIIESEASKSGPEAAQPVAAKNSTSDEDGARRLPSKKEFLTRARKDVPAALRSPPAQSISIRHRMSSTSKVAQSPKQKNASSTAETYEDSDGSGSPELGIDDDDIYIRPPPPSAAALSAAKKEKLAEEKNKKKENTTPPLPPIKICVPNPAKLEPPPIKLKIKLPFKPAVPFDEIHIKKEVIDPDEMPVLPAEPPLKMTIRLPNNKRKSLEREVTPPPTPRKLRVRPVEEVKVKTPEVEEVKVVEKRKRRSQKVTAEEKETPKKDVFRTPVNGTRSDRIVQVMTDDIGGRIKMRIRKIPESLMSSITPRALKSMTSKSLAPTPKTRLKMNIQKSAGQYSVNFKEVKPVVPISRPLNRGNSGRAMAIRTDPSKLQKKTKSKRNDEITATPKIVKPNSFTNRFNPFASIPSSSTMSPRTPATFLSATPEITNGPKPSPLAEQKPMITVTAPVVAVEQKPVLKSPNQKISALLPWMTDEPAKKPERKSSAAVVKIEPVEPAPPPPLKPQQEASTSNDHQKLSPRASSSMSFLLDDDKSNGVYSFLHSPQRKNEPLPIVDFSDDDDDNDIHTDFSLATERVMAMSTSSAASGSESSYP